MMHYTINPKKQNRLAWFVKYYGYPRNATIRDFIWRDRDYWQDKKNITRYMLWRERLRHIAS